MSPIIRCPNCFYFNPASPDPETISGNKLIAKILPDLSIAIRLPKRRWDGEHQTVVVVGDSFELLCGECLTPVFKKESTTIQLGTLTVTQGSFNAMIGTA